jgi:hypothetical protein
MPSPLARGNRPSWPAAIGIGIATVSVGFVLMILVSAAFGLVAMACAWAVRLAANAFPRLWRVPASVARVVRRCPGRGDLARHARRHLHGLRRRGCPGHPQWEDRLTMPPPRVPRETIRRLFEEAQPKARIIDDVL